MLQTASSTYLNRPATDRQVCLLIAEDNVALNDVLRQVFEQAGCEVVQAFDGPAALDLSRQRQPRVILMDLELPGLYGHVVMRALKRDAATAEIRVVILTAHPEMLRRDDWPAAFAIVRKPCGLDELVAVVEDAVTSR